MYQSTKDMRHHYYNLLGTLKWKFFYWLNIFKDVFIFIITFSTSLEVVKTFAVNTHWQVIPEKKESRLTNSYQNLPLFNTRFVYFCAPRFFSIAESSSSVVYRLFPPKSYSLRDVTNIIQVHKNMLLTNWLQFLPRIVSSTVSIHYTFLEYC